LPPAAASFRDCVNSTEEVGGVSGKGVADVELPDGTIRRAELHGYEASGIGKKEFKIKRFVD
jgi:hypothetical protein